ncbi:MAG TPA: hypothetical protein VII43_04525 [Opitutaceae bacterium]
MPRTLLLISIALASAARAAFAADPSPPPEAAAQVDNAELARIYGDDQGDRSSGKAIDWGVVGPRDLARQARVKTLYGSGQLQTGADYFHAAMVLQHGQAPEDFLLCHELCIAAIIRGNKPARWLAAASEDRFLMNLERPQRFGTQFRSMGDGPMKLYRTEDGVTDALRGEFGVPTLAESKARESRMYAMYKAPSPSPTPVSGSPAAGQQPGRP